MLIRRLGAAGLMTTIRSARQPAILESDRDGIRRSLSTPRRRGGSDVLFPRRHQTVHISKGNPTRRFRLPGLPEAAPCSARAAHPLQVPASIRASVPVPTSTTTVCPAEPALPLRPQPVAIVCFLSSCILSADPCLLASSQLAFRLLAIPLPAHALPASRPELLTSSRTPSDRRFRPIQGLVQAPFLPFSAPSGALLSLSCLFP